MSKDALYPKYKVIKNYTGENVDNCFVLKPDTDTAARIALKAYAEAVEIERPQLCKDLLLWLEFLEGKGVSE